MGTDPGIDGADVVFAGSLLRADRQLELECGSADGLRRRRDLFDISSFQGAFAPDDPGNVGRSTVGLAVSDVFQHIAWYFCFRLPGY